MEYFLHVIQFFNGLDGPHHLKRIIHFQFEFLFGNHAQTGFLGRDVRLLKRAGDRLEGVYRAEDFNRFAAVNHIIRPHDYSKVKRFFVRQLARRK